MNNGDSAQPASPNYLDTFSLAFPPFEDQFNPRFFYAGNALVQRLDLLTHLTQFGDSVILVSGPAGSGKSTLLHRFATQAGSQWQLCLMDASGIDQFFSRLSDSTGISNAANEQELVSQWANQTDTSQLLVIVIDNAEHLDETAFEQLAVLLKHPQAERVRLILFGDPDAQQRLKQVLEQKTFSRTTQVLEVPRLSEEETASYLMYRLAVAGYSGESPFTTTEVRAMCKAADGRPADINRLAHEALLEHDARAKSKRIRSTRTGRNNATRVFWGVASVSVVILAAYMGWQRFYPDSAAPGESPLALAPTGELPLGIPEQAPPTAMPAPVPLADVDIAPPPLPEVSEQTRVAETSQQQAADTPVPDPLPVDPTTLARVTDSPIVPENSAPEKPVSDQVVETQKEEKFTRAASVSEPPAPDSASKQALTQAIDAQPPAAAVPDPAIEKKTESGSGLHREAWLLTQPETAFSLQLLGSRKQKSVTDFIALHKLDVEQAAYYQDVHKGAKWYVLMYGVYPTRQAAIEGRSTLPPRVRNNKPWPRTLKSVHSAIHEAR